MAPSARLRSTGARSAALALGCALAVTAMALAGCRKTETAAQTAPSASVQQKPKALSPELAGKVLAKVGDRTITLGEYAATLERMDPFERLRYQSPERRKQLLDEMIEVELLAQEARRRGLDRQPEVQDRLRQMLRDELLDDVKQGLPATSELPEAEVRAYYEKHKEEFSEPERRRVAVIAVSSEAEAKRLLGQAKGAAAELWGKLVEKHSKAKKLRPGPPPPTELAGDLGIVGPPGDTRSSNPRVPEPVREAVFKLEKSGDTYGEVVRDGSSFYIVRMTGRTEPRSRSYQDAERAIRVAVVQAKIREREAALERELRQKFQVLVDEAAVAKLEVPSAAPSPGKPKP